MKFLIVDNSPTMRRVVITSLKALNYNDYVEADDGVEALKILHDEVIDIIITDWDMPNMNGIELIQKVRNDNSMKDIPILLVTTRSDKNDIVTAINLKINNYIVKPFTPDVFEKKLEPLINKYNYTRSLASKNSVNIDFRIDKNFSTNKPIDDINFLYSIISDRSIVETKLDNFSSIPHNFSIINKLEFSNNVIHITTNLIDAEGKTIDTSIYSYLLDK